MAAIDFLDKELKLKDINIEGQSVVKIESEKAEFDPDHDDCLEEAVKVGDGVEYILSLSAQEFIPRGQSVESFLFCDSKEAVIPNVPDQKINKVCNLTIQYNYIKSQ